jgi:hypothetical protein
MLTLDPNPGSLAHFGLIVRICGALRAIAPILALMMLFTTMRLWILSAPSRPARDGGPW